MGKRAEVDYEPDELEAIRALSDVSHDRPRLLRITGTTTGHRTFAILPIGAQFIIRITDDDSSSDGSSAVQAEAGLLRKLDDQWAEILFFTGTDNGSLRSRPDGGDKLILSPDTPVIRIRMG